MKKFINNIKKYFIYVVGIIFFIIAIYVMLMPPNCALNRMNIKEGFADPDPNATSASVCHKDGQIYDSIICYRNLVSQNNLTPANLRDEFDKKYLKNYNSSLPEKEKRLIMSRCYEIQGNTDLLINSISSKNQSKMFTSYTEVISDLKGIREFSEVLDRIDTNINTFYDSMNIPNKNNNKVKISGCVYALIFQIPFYQDSTNNNSIDIKNNAYPQSKNFDDKLIYYSPSVKGNIANNINNDRTSQNTYKTNNPISYYVYIIYDAYKTGVNSTTGIQLASKKNTFSTANTRYDFNSPKGISKKFLDNNYLSGAEQCYIATMGSTGQSYIGGCTSQKGNNTINTVRCQSQIQGDEKEWSYVVLYTINRPEKISDIVYSPPD